MNLSSLPKLKIGDLEIPVPIIQGGMGVGISLSRLASAVANEGGVGVISSVGISFLNLKSKESLASQNSIALKRELQKARAASNGIIGVNIMVAVSDYASLVMTAIKEKADILFLGAGLPLRFPSSMTVKNIQESKTKFVPIVSSARAANIIFRTWAKNFNCVPDAVVVEGPKAGGHLGFKKEQIDDPNFSLEKLVPSVKNALHEFEDKFKKKISLIAAGGIFNGKDIKDIIACGADGVQLGTRFVATNECDASDEFKNTYINCKESDLEIIQSPVGLPGRAIHNKFLADVLSGFRRPINCPWQCLKTCDVKKSPYCIANALISAQKGKLKNGFAFAGANAYKIKEIISVKELFQSLKDEYSKAK